MFYLLSEGLNLGILHSSEFHPILPILMEQHKNGNFGIESASPIQGKKYALTTQVDNLIPLYKPHVFEIR